MIKMLYCVKRLPEMSEQEFNVYWREQHAPFIKDLAPALQLKRYVQTRTLDIPFNEVLQRSRRLGEPYDGIAELWWGSEDEMVDALSSDEGMDANLASMEDEARFIDMPNSCAWICEDHVVYESE
jgi:uncharacterized protein (TIGR02118 family)